jgi:hypothetical protein
MTPDSRIPIHTSVIHLLVIIPWLSSSDIDTNLAEHLEEWNQEDPWFRFSCVQIHGQISLKPCICANDFDRSLQGDMHVWCLHSVVEEVSDST